METVKAGSNRLSNGHFAKGNSGNPKGRPRSPEIELLRQALERAAKDNNKDFLQHFVERAYKNDIVAVALAKKLIPDKLEGEGFGTNLRLFQQFGESELRGIVDFLRNRVSQEKPIVVD